MAKIDGVALDTALAKLLGYCYGGPAIGYHKDTGEFLLYQWHDAPVGYDVIARAKTLTELVRRAQAALKQE